MVEVSSNCLTVEDAEPNLKKTPRSATNAELKHCPFTPPPLARPTSKSLLSTSEIVLIAVTAVAIIVIVSIFVFLTFNHLTMNQTNSPNQTNFSSFIFKIQEWKREQLFSPGPFWQSKYLYGFSIVRAAK
jgi:hypothetical protein